MRAQTPSELFAALRWVQLAFFFLFASTVWFVYFYLRAGRRWLAWSVTGLRFLYLIPTFLFGINVNYIAIPTLRRAKFLGETVTLLGGTTNPLTLLGQSAVLLMLIFVVDASRTSWRRGDRRQAVVVGGSVAFFILTGLASTSIVMWANAPVPVVVSWCYLGILVAMGFELSRDVMRANQLLRDLLHNQASLHESDARMNLAADAGNVGIWTWHPHRDEVWASEQWRLLFGFSPTQTLRYEEILERLHPDDRDAVRQTHVMALAGQNDGRFQMEYRLLQPDASVRWIASTGRVEFDASRSPMLIRGAMQEVTTRKNAEAETQLLRQELAHAGRISMMGQLASGLAHEINQPLASILRNAEAAEVFLQHPSPDLNEIREILGEIRSDDERAASVIDRMRALIKPHALELQPLDVDSLIRDVARLVRVDAAARQIKLTTNVAAPLPEVRGDRVQLQQVLLNLVLNGMDALRESPPERRRVGIVAHSEIGQTVEIAVFDEGCGIAEESRARIFEPFFTTKSGGMGMGLAISRGIVESHEGRIWADNLGSGGAVFRFVLPVAGEAAAS
jgi:C4-dicarboxylate-specific signal transduction histidine kinase